MFKKIYVEITNCCNLSCEFCASKNSKREKIFMNVADFELTVQRIKPYTDYVYLHVLGEPLLHPNLDEILNICADVKLKVCIVTNGVLIEKTKDILLKHKIYKIAFSLHSFTGNDIHAYMNTLFTFAEKASENTIVEYRFWADGGKNNELLKLIEEYYTINISGGGKIKKNIYTGFENRFEWPDINAEKHNKKIKCYGLTDHIAVLSDGTVTACCLDYDGHISLGNIKTDKLEDIINGERPQKIKDGFKNRKAAEELCKRCRFSFYRL